MAAASDSATAKLLQQFVLSLMASQLAPDSVLYGGPSGYGDPAPDPVLDPAGHAAHSKNAQSDKRRRAEAMAKHLLSLHRLELTQQEALSPVPTSVPLLALHALTPRQATQYDEKKTLFWAHKTRQFRVELEQFDDDIAGRKEAMIKFGELVCTSTFGPDWYQWSQMPLTGKTTPSAIYSDYGADDDSFDKPTSTYAPASAMQSKLQKAAGELAHEGLTAASRKKALDDLQWELLRWDSARTREQALDTQEEPFDEYGIDNYDDWVDLYRGAGDYFGPYPFKDSYNPAYFYDENDAES
ncbi:hypothetical protein EX895_004923 [Sporisorium graminicola]|uniref:Uncharacterized protein n=1 Tax=Sporisorium graminicola TaxID=280036 RepID=A0A4U7KS74_9BASI|nr:hypothetical protein EX895_004923 [Sporisorium graminicola]TKY86098.1 hypothetical protein EX895_004923 [Sporisorium graminicola]